MGTVDTGSSARERAIERDKNASRRRAERSPRGASAARRRAARERRAMSSERSGVDAKTSYGAVNAGAGVCGVEDAPRDAPMVLTERAVARARGARAAALGGAAAVLAALAYVSGWNPVHLGKRALIDVEFKVDVGCVPARVMDESPIKDFWDNDIQSVSLLLKGAPPCEFGGHRRRCGAVTLAQDGYSTVFKGTARVPKNAEYGFALVNSAGQTIFELGRNKRFPKRGELANDQCLTSISAGGGKYRNRVLPKSMTPNANGVYSVSTTWAGCEERCPLTVKLVATVAPATGDASNVFLIEEAKARTDTWRPCKGHFSSVSSGEFNTWGLDNEKSTLKWTRNADLNPFNGGNWVAANNIAVDGSTSYGPVVDIDVGYAKVYGVTADLANSLSPTGTYGGRVWTRNVDGTGGWTAVTGLLKQVTIGRTTLWGVNGAHQLFRCADPCGPTSHWAGEGENIKQIEVGDSDAFIVFRDDVTIQRKSSDGSGTWANVPRPSGLTKVDQLTVGATALWILDGNGGLWSCDLPCAGGPAITRVEKAPAGIISIDAGKVIHSLIN